jgi:hypothetical protein
MLGHYMLPKQVYKDAVFVPSGGTSDPLARTGRFLFYGSILPSFDVLVFPEIGDDCLSRRKLL